MITNKLYGDDDDYHEAVNLYRAHVTHVSSTWQIVHVATHHDTTRTSLVISLANDEKKCTVVRLPLGVTASPDTALALTVISIVDCQPTTASAAVSQ